MTVELIELQDSARRVIGSTELAAPETALWGQITALGWLLVSVPEALSGLDMGSAGASTLHAELGRGLSTAPFLPAMLVIDAVCQSGLSERERENWLERLVGGTLVSTSLADCSLRADGNRLNGTVTGVQSADAASHILVWTADNKTVALVALAQSGIEVIARPTWDQTRRLFDVCLHNVDLSSQTVLANGAAAEAMIQRLLVQRDFGLAADAIGAASAVLEITVEHLQTRVQFKRPLAMFQALKHRCADMKAAIAAADAMLFDALRQVNEQLESPAARTRSMGAKLFSTSMFAHVAEDCLQLHGGIGMADEHPCHLFLKRSLLSEQLSGVANTYAIEIASRLVSGTK